MSHGAVVVTQLVVFLAKVLLMSSFQILVRWSLPRFRYDQLLSFAWKFMFPLALANLIVTAVLAWANQAVDALKTQTVPAQGVLERAHDDVVGAVVDDNCLLDAKGDRIAASASASGVFIGRNTSCRARTATSSSPTAPTSASTAKCSRPAASRLAPAC